jgi:hypothetical protein
MWDVTEECDRGKSKTGEMVALKANYLKSTQKEQMGRGRSAESVSEDCSPYTWVLQIWLIPVTCA